MREMDKIDKVLTACRVHRPSSPRYLILKILRQPMVPQVHLKMKNILSFRVD